MSAPQYLRISHPWVNHDRLPIYEWGIPGPVSDAELQSFFDAREQWAKAAQYPVCWIAELSHVTQATATQRKMFADHLKRFELHDAQWNRGTALIVPNSFIRGLVTAVFWLAPPKFPHQLFATREQAVLWAEERAKEIATGARGAH